jgi:predicted nucleic acid binding AN1-type Zn finger protein
MRCEYCKKKKGMLLDCRYCKNEYCSKCICLENHKCKNIEDCKKRKRNELENKLNLEKSEKNKIIKI